MPTLNRLHGAFIASVLVTGASAYAGPNDAPNDPQPRAGEPTLTDPPGATQCEDELAGCPQQQPAPVTPAPAPAPAPQASAPAPMPMPLEEEPHRLWYERLGVGLSIGGGVDDFVGDAFRGTTGTGGSWNVRATFGTRQYIAGEVSYIGSAQSIDAIGLDDDATLIGNGLQGAVRVNVLRNYYVQPFIYGGAAWRHYDLSNESFNTSDVADSDDVFEVPIGIGFAGYIGGFMADLRGEYRGAWGNDLIPAFEDLDSSSDDTIFGEMDRWGVTASLGMEF